MTSPPITVAVDGTSGSGKSSVARAVAVARGWRYLDTGAMYRIVTLAVLRASVDPTDEAAVAALLPELTAAWSLSATGAGALTGAFFGGYRVAVPVLTALTDRMDARKVYLAATLLAAFGNAGLALLARDFVSGVIFQVVSGVGLAGMYMPGLKLLSDHVTGPKQSRYVAFYTSSFGVGASVSYLVTGAVAAMLD